MEVGEASRKELQEQVSWIPTTPVKPILPRSVPICWPKEGNQLDQTNCSRTSSCCISSNDSVVACFESSPGAEIKSSPQDWAAPAATVTNVAVHNVGTCVQPSFDNLSIWNNVRFSDLLALADAASAHTNATHLGNGMKIRIIPTLKSQFKGDPVANPTSTFLSHHNLSTDQITSSTIYGNPQEPQGTPCSAYCSKTISQFAPPTPDKAIGAQGRQIAGMQINMEEKYQGEEETTLLATKLDVSEIPHNQELCDLVMESSFAAVSMPFKENHNPDKEGSHGTNLNRMPQQKLRRNKHRPKVITEDKPKKTRIPVIPKPCQSKENQTGKRKYVRRKGLNSTSTTPPTEVTGEFTELMMPEFNKKSCRKSLNFDIEEQSRDENSACRENATVHLCKGIGVSIAEMHVSLACDLNFSMKQGLNDYKSLPEDTQAPSMSLLKSNSPGTKLNAHSVKNNSKRKSRVTSQDGQQNNAKMTSKSRRPSSPNYSNSNNSGILITGFQMGGSKRKHFSSIEHADTSSINLIGVQYNGLQAYQAMCRDQFPNVSKKRISGKGKISNTSNSDRQSFNDTGAPQTCNEPLVAEKHTSLTKKEWAIKNILASSTYSSTNEAQVHHQFVLDALTEQFRHLKINREARDQALHEQNTLIPYNQQNQKNKALVHGGGIIIPLESAFEHIRKRTRPKVELDEETNRVWQLLLLDINSHGVDGTDEEKAKWWEEERRVFRGRADSFIARMHLVQGDRRFSQWKGSVVDSAIGVFLTQNVSDHLSSSAFMSLAARFPLKSSSNCKTYHEEGTSLVVSKPQVHIVEPEENTKYDQNSTTKDIIERSEETEAVNSNDSSRTTCTVICEPQCSMLCGPTDTITGEGQETSYGGVREELNDKVSSQCSVISSQISGNFSTDQNLEKIGSCSDSNSEVEDLPSAAKYNIFDNITSFTKLLEMASSTMLHEVNSQGSKSTENLKDAYDQSIGMKHDNQTENLEISDVIQGSLEASIITSCEHTLKMTPNSGFDIHCFDTFKRESICGFSKSKDENDMDNPSLQTTETPAAITHSQSMLAQLHLQDQSNNMQQSLFCSSGQTQNLMQKARDLDSGDQNYAVWNEPLERNAAPTRPKSRRLGKKKKDNINWDNLRKQALAKTGKRERTANTMDSLDWDAVRCADVNEIADAIKDRGMNNVLAERIKNFLNRLVEEHGDIDLEWLREVPPDQAKEYLLSIRGLGLKSVECVRLLTLHHLAFPVDTNVGRIAVRLGWVPLQPLPESLQLHLLEMYPVLESIQKYLWPRLCKLEQRTLYELHYQMITFGKVFCTKSKPNCNACPMRGECRHFASAFASARLALPGPEQNSIVSTAGNNATDQNRSIIVSPLSLPLPGHTNQAEEIQQTEVSRQLESNSEINICQPIIEEPATPEQECTQIAENDIEDAFYGDPCEIPTIKLNIEEFTLNLQSYMQENMELEECEMSKALVALTPEAASIPTPKLKNVSQLRTEHCVYELPDSHPLLQGWDNREPDDPCKYLLAIWTPGESATSIQPPESKCSSQECGQLCNEKECFACNSIREANSQIVRGTLLIPCRTAMRGSFPLNGTYFQVNEVFADHDSSLNPINVPRSWIWNLNRRTVYFGTSIPSIFKGLSTQEIQQCFWRGYVCVRGFDRERRAPRPLMARLHFPASKLGKAKDKTNNK